uniref:ubiquitinyl hydrolase 1 n=1 Tax=Davidia involucrata TaxID=16924 RepID=A0A5B7AWF5_DAVIN
MITYEQDPDVVRWGLQLFDGDPFSNCGYCGTITQNDEDYYHEQYFKEDYYDTGCSNVENDELIAQALQEELSQLSVAEAPGSPHEGVEHLQASFYPPDWLDQSMGNYTFGHDNGHEEADDMGPSSSCSSPEGNSYCGEDWSYSMELTDEYALDGEVGKRLNQMVPIPHVPRINGEIPSVDEATLDHQRLLDRLQLYQLVEFKVQGDGNCQFRALSDQIYRTPEHHKFVRQQIVNQLESYPEIYEGYVPMAYGDYLKKMSESGQWGDHVTLQAAADSYGLKIFVITSFKDTCYIEILPNVQRSERVISLSFWAEVHYNSIYPEGDMPTFETKKNKRWWDFQDKHLESSDEYS